MRMNKVPQAIVILHRHGHRAPARNVMPEGASYLQETALWTSLCNIQSHHLNDRFPIRKLHDSPNTDDVTYPFGAITTLGVKGLQERAVGLANKFPILKSIPKSSTSVVSTNYKRTQLSAQIIWNGLHGHQPLAKDAPEIVVMQPDDCNMSFFDQIAAQIIGEVQQTKAFRKLEDTMLPVKEHMSGALPGLNRRGKGFDWMGAMDYFTCRRAHHLPVDSELQLHERAVFAHICDRYYLYMRTPRYLSNFAGPLLQNICDLIEKVKTDSASSSTNLNIFSGHDINILGLLYATNAWPILPPHNTYWPDFATTLTIEVMSPQDIRLYLNDEPVECRVPPSAHSTGHGDGFDTTLLVPTDRYLQKRSLTLDDLLRMRDNLAPFLVQK